MKQLILFLLLFTISIRAQYTKDPNTKIVNDVTGNYKTIAAALNAFRPGDIIVIGPKTFNEDITIADSGVVLKGMDPIRSKINKLTITARDVSISDITVLDSLNLLSQEAWNYIYLKNFFDNVTFYGNCNFSCQYPFEFNACKFLGPGTDFYFDCGPAGQNNYFRNCYVNGWAGEVGGQDLDNIDFYLHEGQVVFSGGHYYLDSLYYDDPVEISLFYFEYMSNCYIGGVSSPPTTNQFRILQCKFGKYYWYRDMQFDGRFELVVHDCDLNFGWGSEGGDKDLIYNSIANSRIFNVTQYGYQSTSTISGTGLNVLHIENSTFYMDAPAGLGTDMGNCWNCFIDN